MSELSSSTTILVVEDEAIVALDLRTRLERLGYQVCGTAANGAAALEIASRTLPTLILMDIAIQGPIDGIETATRILHSVGAPVIFLTAYGDPATIERAKEAQPYGFLLKPFDERELQATIETAVHRRRIEENSRLLHQAVVATNTGILVALLGRAGLQTVLCNPAFERITGFAFGDVSGRSPWVLEGPETEAHLATSLHEAVEAQREIQVTLPLHRKDGTAFWSDLAVSYVRDVTGRATHALFFFLDVTARRAAEAALVQAQKAEGIGRLAGGVAHDFNNILAVISGYAEMTQKQLGVEHPALARLDQILKATKRGTELTKQLLAFGRHQALRLGPLNLNTVVDESARMLGRLLGADIQLAVSKDPSLGLIKADAGQMGQVVMNLAVNARDAMPSGGVLTIETRNKSVRSEFTGSYSRVHPGGYVVLSVSDTGHGMSRATKERMFDAFFTTKPEGKGTGLGLYTVQGIVRQAGGHIVVDSSPDHGARFEIFFPRLDGAALESRAVESQQEPGGGSETILLVEDNEALRGILREVLEEKGYKVLVAGDGQEALSIAADFAGRIHLLVTDVVMPKLGGRHVAASLSVSRPGIRFIFMSGYTDREGSDPGLRDGSVTLLEKPFENADLARAVRAELDKNTRT